MASFFQSERNPSPRVGLRGFPSIPGVDSFILGSIRFRIQISSLVRTCRGHPGPALGFHWSPRGKATSPGSYREADEGRIRTRAPGCCFCLSPPCSAYRISPWSDAWVRKIPWRRDRLPTTLFWASLVAQLIKNQPAMRVTWVQPQGWEDLLAKGMATHSSILAWTPWGHTESVK